jgi:hypothetical protein
MTKYARDEFDRLPEASSRQGVHRAAPGPSSRRLGPILTVGIAALAIGLVAFLILPKLGFSAGDPLSMLTGTSAAASGSTPSTEATAGNSETGSATSSPSAAPLATTSESSPPSSSPSPSVAAIDKTQPVAVYNGTATAGLAGRVAQTVQSAGWPLGTVGNWGGLPQKTSVIYYSDEAQKDAAVALGTLLKIPTQVESTEFQLPLVVVLGPGYQ